MKQKAIGRAKTQELDSVAIFEKICVFNAHLFYSYTTTDTEKKISKNLFTGSLNVMSGPAKVLFCPSSEARSFISEHPNVKEISEE